MTSGAAYANWGQFILAVIAAVGVLYTGYRWLKKNVAVPLRAVPQIQQDVCSLKTDVVALKRETHPNAGKTLRDSNDRTEVLMRAVAEKVGVDVDDLVQPQTPPAKTEWGNDRG